jgi:hypothetical protein
MWKWKCVGRHLRSIAHVLPYNFRFLSLNEINLNLNVVTSKGKIKWNQFSLGSRSETENYIASL